MSTRQQILERVHSNTIVERCKEKNSNSGLWFDKYIENQSTENKEARSAHVTKVAALPVPSIYTAFFSTWERMLKTHQAVTTKAHVQGRMIVGLGNESVIETSITLHHTYGVPYIPGSALKGLAASYARQYLADDWKDNGEAFKIVFGNTDEAGFITFYDALYIPGSVKSDSPLSPDVMTVHHRNYYGGTEAPTDMDDPNPISFLSAHGSFLIAVSANDIEDKAQRKAWINATLTLLHNALIAMGIGAKTSSGYGRLSMDFNPSKQKYIRPNIGTFKIGNDVQGSVIAQTEKFREMVPDAKCFLRFREFPTSLVLIVIESRENVSWAPGQDRMCIFQREEEIDGCAILFCTPKPSSEKKKNKNKK